MKKTKTDMFVLKIQTKEGKVFSNTYSDIESAMNEFAVNAKNGAQCMLFNLV